MSKTEETGWRGFLKLCEKIHTAKQFDLFFDMFLTYEEREAVAKRFEIARALLKNDKPQREIAKELETSIAKITRGSNYLKTIDEKFKKFLIENMT